MENLNSETQSRASKAFLHWRDALALREYMEWLVVE